MKRLSYAGCLLVLLWLAGAAEARKFVMNDYAYGMPLQVDGDGALYSLFLPAQVYRNTVAVDLSDLQVFNAHGEPVPQRLLPPTMVSDDTRQLIGATLYPVPTRPSQPLEEEAPTSIGNERPLIDFYSGPLPLPGAGAGEYYLADASQHAGRVARLHLYWSESSEALITQVSVDVSDDLSQWRPLLERQGIASLQLRGYHLDHHILELPQSTDAKYFRIHWPPGSRGVTLRGVKLELQQTQQIQSTQRLLPSTVKEDSACYEFDMGGHFPVDGVRVLLPQMGLALEGALLSRTSGQKNWQPRYRGLFYDLEREGERLRNAAIALAPQAHAQWCLSLGEEAESLGTALPMLEMAWRPQRLLFVARGEMPFTLAFGRYGRGNSAPPGDPRLARIGKSAGQLGMIKPAVTGELFELGGKRRLLQPAPPDMWQKWYLWLALLLGVVVLLWLRQQQGKRQAQ